MPERAAARGSGRAVTGASRVFSFGAAQGASDSRPVSHAVSRLRAERRARSVKPFRARGSRSVRCARCRLPDPNCLCALRPTVTTRAGICLLMHEIEPMRPTNTGWLVADVVADTEAYTWSRTEPQESLLALLRDPQRAPYVVFPSEGVDPQRVVSEVTTDPARRPLFVLLDGTWSEAHKMFRKSRYLEGLPVLALRAERNSRYRLRCTRGDAQLCTAEVAALCLDLAGETHAAHALDAWLDVFIERTLDARRTVPSDPASSASRRLAAIARGPGG